MFPISPLIYALLAASILGVGVTIGYKFEHGKTVIIQTQYDKFVATTKAQGEAAEARNVAVTKEFERVKNEQDKLYNARIATLNSDVKRLHLNSSASRSYLPKVAGASSNPNRVCFDRTKLDESIRNFDSGIQRLIEQGDTQGIGLLTAKEWVKELKAP